MKRKNFVAYSFIWASTVFAVDPFRISRGEYLGIFLIPTLLPWSFFRPASISLNHPPFQFDPAHFITDLVHWANVNSGEQLKWKPKVYRPAEHTFADVAIKSFPKLMLSTSQESNPFLIIFTSVVFYNNIFTRNWEDYECSRLHCSGNLKITIILPALSLLIKIM